MSGIVDRIEDNIIVIEVDKSIYNINKCDINIDFDINEGDVVDIVFESDKIVSIKKNSTLTQKRKDYINDLTKDMWE